MVLPSELHLQVASYLEPPDLKSYSLVSKQIRACALECMLFDTHDKETMQRAVGAGARKLRLTCDNTVVDDVVEHMKVVELNVKLRDINVVDLSVFKNLTVLKIQDCGLKQLPVLPPTLVALECDRNTLTQLPTPLPSTLVALQCSVNQLTQLPPILPPGLVALHCGYNNLTQLPPLPSTLVTLGCSSNQLTQLPVLPSTLVSLFCYENRLTELPVLPQTLVTLYCHVNELTELPSLPSTLVTFECYGNPLTRVPAFSTMLTLFGDSCV